MCPIMGEYTKPEADTDIATHAALAITHGAVDAIADQADIAIHAALTTGVHGVGIGTVGSKPINRLAGVQPIAASWTSAPDAAHLLLATNGDWTDTTGDATINAVATGDLGAGYIRLDMGAIYNVLVNGLVTLTPSIAWTALNLVMRVSLDASTWVEVLGFYNAQNNTYVPSATDFNFSVGVRARYLQLQMFNTGAQQNLSLAIRELQAIDLGV